MKFLDAIRLALDTIRVQKLKSFFTLLGVAIGVMFLIAIVSVVEGMNRYMEHDLVGKLVAVNSVELRNHPYVNLGDVDDATWVEWRKRPRIIEDDIHPVQDALPPGTLNYVISEDNLVIQSQYARPKEVHVYAVTGDYFTITKMGVTEGRTFTAQELESGALVVVIGQDVKTKFFPTVNPIDHQIKMGGIPYTVVGIAETQGSVFGQSLDKFVIAPYRAPVHRLLNRDKGVIDGIIVQAPSPIILADATERVRQVMRTRHKLHPAQADDFSMETPESTLGFWNKMKVYLRAGAVLLPAIGLVVGGIVIMNIMLVAVAERTREIGIRKSLGARRGDILLQFLIESSTLSVLGAIIGILLGVAIAEGVTKFSFMPVNIVPWSIWLAIIMGGGVGICAGVYPAMRASKLDPIAALRQE
jgi:putative ABC transport system permease protein